MSALDDAMKFHHAAEFRRCLVEMDIAGVRRLWRHVAPFLTQPSNDLEAMYCLHLARTGADTLPLKLRQYSARWLRERGYGSLLDPDKVPANGGLR